MTDTLPTDFLKDFPLGLDPADRSPRVPTDPALAKARLAERETTPGYFESLMDRRHPLHALRTQERQGLQIIAARAPSALPATPRV